MWLRLKAFFCRHHHRIFLRNIYGDEILRAGGCRSLWWCRDCNCATYRKELGNAERQVGVTRREM